MVFNFRPSSLQQRLGFIYFALSEQERDKDLLAGCEEAVAADEHADDEHSQTLLI